MSRDLPPAMRARLQRLSAICKAIEPELGPDDEAMIGVVLREGPRSLSTVLAPAGTEMQSVVLVAGSAVSAAVGELLACPCELCAEQAGLLEHAGRLINQALAVKGAVHVDSLPPQPLGKSHG